MEKKENGLDFGLENGFEINGWYEREKCLKIIK